MFGCGAGACYDVAGVKNAREGPDSMVQPMQVTPANWKDVDIETVKASLPSMSNAEIQAMLAYLLKAAHDNPFREYNAPSDPFPKRCDFSLHQLDVTQRNHCELL